MKKRYLIILNVFYFVSILLIFVFGPFYSNYSRENFEDWEPTPFVQNYTLNFTSQQVNELLAPTFLDFHSYVVVNFNSTQPTYILLADVQALETPQLPFYEKSKFGNESGALTYYIAQPANYTVLAEGFHGTANVTVAILISIVTRTKPYAMWGQAMYYGGIGLLGVSLAGIVISWLRKEPAQPKQPPRAVSARKPEKGR